MNYVDLANSVNSAAHRATRKENRMRRAMSCLAIGALFTTGAAAQSLTAGDLAKHCSAGDTTEEKAVCSLVIKTFMDGFIEGVGKGVMGVYAFDSRVLSTVADTPMKEMAPRIQQVADKATCIQRVSVGELAAAFVKYVRAEPSLASKNYREALTRTIVANYCQK
jgi:hypothetical protein